MSLHRNLEGFTFQGHDGDQIDFDDQSGALQAGGAVINFGHFMELRAEGDFYAVYHWHDWQTDVRKFLFRNTGHESMLLHAVELPAGPRLTLDYDDLGRPITVRQSVEQRGLRLEYSASGFLGRLWLTSPEIADNLCTEYEYDSQGRLISVINRTGSAIRYEYDAHHRLIRETPRLGGSYDMKYDSQGRCIEVGGHGSYNLRRLQYDKAGRTTKVSDSLGNETLYQFNDRGQVDLETLPNGSVRLTQFDEHGRIVVKGGPLAKVTNYKYSDRGDLIEITYANGACTKFTFNENHQATSVEQPNKGRWQFEYERGALSAIIDPLGSETRYIRDGANVIIGILTAAGNRIQVETDVAWSRQTYSDELGLIRTAYYDSRLNITEIHDAQGLRNRFSYDAAGRLIGITQADGSLTQIIRGSAAQILKYIDPTGSTTSYEYSPYGNTLRVTNPNGFSHSYVWDTEGRLVQMVNPKNETASFEYDSVGNILHATSFDGRVDCFEYDVACCRTRWRKPNGTILQFTHDELHHLLAISDGTTELVGYQYDLAGHIVAAKTPEANVTFEYDVCGRLTAEVQSGRRVEYKYHLSGDIAQRSFEGARNRPLLFRYDKRGRMVSIEEEGRTLEHYTYNNRNLLVRRNLGRVSEVCEHDVRRRLQSQTVYGAGGVIVARKYAYDAAGRLIRVADSVRGDVLYGYDPGERLVHSFDSRRGAARYEYDPCGNLLRNAAGDSLVYESGNRLVRSGSQTYDRDPNGNLTAVSSPAGVTRFSWNALDQLVEVVDDEGVRTRFAYDATGRRISRDRRGQTTYFYWAGNDLLSEESGGNVTDYAIGTFGPNMIWENGHLRYVICSYRQMPYELIDEDGRVLLSCEYGDWGELRDEIQVGRSNRLRLPGQYADAETGLHYNRFRYYSPGDARFISPDPMGLQAGPNEFLYAPNAIGWVDPLGLECGNKGCDKNSVYVLTKGDPPEIVYVGITAQTVEERLSQHASNPDKDFDNMTVIATGLDRRDARNIEGSALYNIGTGNVVSANTGLPMDLQNAMRNDDMPYHSYTPDTPHTLYSPAQSANQLNQDIRTLPNPNN